MFAVGDQRVVLDTNVRELALFVTFFIRVISNRFILITDV